MTVQRGPAYREGRANEFLDVAERVVRQLGLGWSVEDVAAAVGVARPVLYRYFGSRDGLADALATRITVRLGDAVLTAVFDGTNLTRPRTAIRDGIEAYLTFIEAEPTLYRFAISHRSSTPPPSESPSPHLERPADGPTTAADDVIDHLGRGIAAGLADALRLAGRDPAPAEVWAHGIVGMIAFAGEWWLQRGAPTLGEMTDHLTELASSGLGLTDGLPVGSAGATTSDAGGRTRRTSPRR